MSILFTPVVPETKLNRDYNAVRTAAGYEPARLMLDEVFRSFHDPDGNFVEQFQTHGFNARLYELYLFAYFSHSGFEIDRSYPQPDFLVSRNSLTVAVEATTANPSQPLPDASLEDESRGSSGIDKEALMEKLNNELPVRLGSPLYSKLNKHYWELPHVKNKPVVIAIEAFHEPRSLSFSEHALIQYLYGLRSSPRWDASGSLVIDHTPIQHHKFGKTIPSGFFSLPDAEHISAILFTNSGTISKFSRLGHQEGFHRGNVVIIREGTCNDPDPNSATPGLFRYDLADPPFIETWGQGLVVAHNPDALVPIPRDFFSGTVQYYIEDGKIATDVPGFHPFASNTLMFHNNVPMQDETGQIVSLLKRDFDSFSPVRMPLVESIARETEWYSAPDKNLLGIVIQDRIDEDWVYVILGPDEQGKFRAIESQFGGQSRDECRSRLFERMLCLT